MGTVEQRKDRKMILEEVEENYLSLIDKQDELLRESNTIINSLIEQI